MNDVNTVPQSMSVTDIAMRRSYQLTDMCETEVGRTPEKAIPFCTKWNSAIPDEISEVGITGAELTYQHIRSFQQTELEVEPKR